VAIAPGPLGETPIALLTVEAVVEAAKGLLTAQA
jgi:hypothetical protein